MAGKLLRVCYLVLIKMAFYTRRACLPTANIAALQSAIIDCKYAPGQLRYNLYN